MCCRYPKITFGLLFLGILLWWFSREVAKDPELPHVPVPPVPPQWTALDEFRRDWDADGTAQWKVAEYLCSLSNTAYEVENVVRERANTIGFKNVRCMAPNSMSAFVAWQDDVMVIAFRGTNAGEGADWIVNLNIFVPNEADRGVFHPGFAGAYSTMRQEIEDIVRKVQPKYLWITGHSLGGALAAICAYELTEKKIHKPTGVMTFGQPMVGNLVLAEKMHRDFKGRFVRFVNEGDPVEKVPPFFRHFGARVLFTPTGIYRTNVVYGDAKTRREHRKDEETPSETQAMSPQEFEALKVQIAADKVQRRATPDGPVQAALPRLWMHFMSHYTPNVMKWVINNGKEPHQSTGATARPSMDAASPKD